MKHVDSLLAPINIGTLGNDVLIEELTKLRHSLEVPQTEPAYGSGRQGICRNSNDIQDLQSR